MKNLKGKINFSIFLTIFFILSACSSRPEYSQATPQKTIEYAIHLLENKKFDTLIYKLAAPRITKGKSQESIARMIENFAKHKAPRLLTSLKKIKFNDTITQTDTRIKYKNNDKRPITLIKVDSKWYIGN